MVFGDDKSFYQTAEKLGKLNPDELEKWNNQYRLTSLLEKSYKTAGTTAKADEENPEEDVNGYENIPPAIRSLLNENGEVQIGEFIIWYHQGKRHFVSSDKKEELEKIKQNPELSKSFGFYSIKNQGNQPQKKAGNIQTDANLTGFPVFFDPHDARYTSPEYCRDAVGCWTVGKYVYELWSYSEYTNVPLNTPYPDYYNYWTSMYLKMKLERKNKGRWVQSHDDRELLFNFEARVRRMLNVVDYFGSWSPIIVDFGTFRFSNINQTEAQRTSSGDYWHNIMNYGGNQCYCGPWVDPVWRFEITGWIYQKHDNAVVYLYDLDYMTPAITPLW